MPSLHSRPAWPLFAEDAFDDRDDAKSQNLSQQPAGVCPKASRAASMLPGLFEFLKNGAPAPIGGSKSARGKPSRWAHDLADTRLAIRRGGIGARQNGALALLKSANSRQFEWLA